VVSLDRIESSIPADAYFEWDLSNEEFRQRALRDYVHGWARKDPFYVRRMGLAAILCTRAKHVREVLMDAKRFVMKSPPLPGYEVFDVFGGLESVLQLDGERHARVRRLMNPAFSPVGLTTIKAAIERIVAERIEVIAAAGSQFDAMADFADHLIMHALLDATFELSKEQQAAFERVHKAIAMAPKFRPGQPRPKEYTDAIDGIRGVITEVIEERRRKPGKDFISNLITARDEGNKLSDGELYGQINTICGSALGSTAATLGAALYRLCRHPDQLEKLRRQPELVDDAIEECVRVQGPGLFSFPRFAACDTEVGGTAIFEGMPVLTSPQAASYDPDEFDEPERMDITRKPKSLAFGTGNHHCIGVRLAKLTMRTSLLGLLARFPKLRLADPDFVPLYGGNVGTMTIAALPMRVD
jgi:cytochrome P450